MSGGEVTRGELVRLDLLLSDEMITVWGTVVYSIGEIGFAARFLFSGRDEEKLTKAIRALEAAAASES